MFFFLRKSHEWHWQWKKWGYKAPWPRHWTLLRNVVSDATRDDVLLETIIPAIPEYTIS